MIRRNIVWRTAMETSSQDSVPNYVRNGLGAGLAVQTPDLRHDSGLRVLPLSGFPSLPIGVFWRGKLGEIAQVFVDESVDRAKRIFGKWKAPTDVISRSPVRIRVLDFIDGQQLALILCLYCEISMPLYCL
jgi:hypothetical protein